MWGLYCDIESNQTIYFRTEYGVRYNRRTSDIEYIILCGHCADDIVANSSKHFVSVVVLREFGS